MSNITDTPLLRLGSDDDDATVMGITSGPTRRAGCEATMCWSRWFCIVILLGTFLAGCGSSDPAATATSLPAAQPASTATATLTANPTATIESTPVVTVTPVSTRTATTEPTTTPTPTDPTVYHEIIFNGLIEGTNDWNLRLYSVDADGSDVVPLTNAPDGVWEAVPAVSPDGTRAVFMRGVDGVPDLPEAEVRVLDIETGQETLIVTGVGLDFNWTSDSHQLIFTWYEGGENPCCGGLGGLTSRIVMVNADGSDFQVLSEQYIDPVTGEITEDLEPRLSPDGEQLFVLRTRSSAVGWLQIPAVLDLTTFEVAEFNLGDPTVDYRTSWTPDGQALAFVGGSLTDVNAPHGLYVLPIDGDQIQRLTPADLRVAGFAFSPDGSRVAVAAESMIVMSRAGDVLHEFPLTAAIPHLAWSPDSTRIAYIARESTGSPEHSLCVVTVETGEVSAAMAVIPGTQLLSGIPVWRPAVTVPSAADHGWSDDTLRAVVPGASDAAFPNPLLDYPWVAWNAYAEDAGGRRIVTRHLESGIEVEIARGSNVGWQFAFDDGVVVWLEGGTTLHATSISTGHDLTTAVRETWVPVISTRWVVWSQPASDGRTELMGWDVWTNTAPVRLTTIGDSFCGSYDVSGGLIAWTECASPTGQSRLTVLEIATGEVVRTVERDGVIYPIDLDGSTLVYVQPAADWFSGDPPTIVVEDLWTGETRELVAHVNTHEGAYRITTDGRFIIFEGQPSGYDLQRDAWFDILVNGHSVALEDGTLLWAIPREWGVGPTELHLAPADEFSSGQRSRFFPETNEWLALGFLRYWDANGGVPILGYPLPERYPHPEVLLNSTTLQWTERQRLEWHPENTGTVYESLLGRLGAELLELQGRDWRTFLTADPATPHYFAVTEHAIAPEFWTYWAEHGLDLGDRSVSFRESVALFGYPLSEPMRETNLDGDTVLTQYFERAVFELHPENPDPWKVLLRRLGAEVLSARGW